MESFNLKTLPFAIAAVIFAFLTFQVCSKLMTEIEIVFDINQMLNFFIMLIAFTSITALSIGLFLSQNKNLYYRIGFFALLFLPYASVFLLQYTLTPLMMLFVFVLYIGMAYSIMHEFDSLYGNQIKTYIQVPARANARTIIFITAFISALIFLQVNNTEKAQQQLSEKIKIKLSEVVAQTVEQTNLIESLTGNVNLDSANGMGSEFINSAVNSAVKPKITDMITQQINTMIDPYLQYIVYIATFIIFSTIAGTTTFVSIVTSLFGMLTIKLLKSLGYAKEVKQTIEVTRITM